MKKPVFYTEAAYGVGLLLLALGTAMTAYGDFGISMVVAPAYILHLKISQALPFFSFGMAGYAVQALVLALMMLLLRRWRLTYLLSFATAVLYGLLLDWALLLTGLLPDWLALRLAVYVLGVLLCVAGLSLLFRTYLPPEVYELFVKELAGRVHIPVHVMKTIYDCASCLLAAILSLLFFGEIQGIGIGTVLCAVCYGALIRACTKISERIWVFRDRFSLRARFEGHL